jgi:hypothetical protein
MLVESGRKPEANVGCIHKGLRVRTITSSVKTGVKGLYQELESCNQSHSS